MFVGEDDAPLSGIALELRDGQQAMHARTAPGGLARFDGLTGSGYKLCPYELDKDAWKLLRTEPLSAEEVRGNAPASWEAPVPGLPDSGGDTHTVAQGEALDRLALDHGLFPATVWDHARNRELRAKRESGNVLLAGDKLYLPPIRREQVDAQVAVRHILKRHGVPSRIRIRLFDDMHPLANTAWTLEIPGEPAVTGNTDADGTLATWVPATAASATLTFVAGGDQRQVTISLGSLIPAHESFGWRQRLRNLGFRCHPEGGSELSAEDQGALLRFQDSFGLPLTGEPDSATLDKLYAVHDGAPTQAPSSGIYSAGD